MEKIEALTPEQAESLVSKVSNSILDDVKSHLNGLDPTYKEFDGIICGCIDTAMSILAQLGVIKLEDLKPVSDDSLKWEDLIKDSLQLSMAKQYVRDKVRLMFDPPTSGTLHAALERRVEEFEWRAQIAAEYPLTKE